MNYLDHGGQPSLDVQGGAGLDVSWLGPDPEQDRLQLGRWAAGVGPALTMAPVGGLRAATDGPREEPAAAGDRSGSDLNATCTVVNWNARVGGGALGAFWEHVRQVAPSGPVVLLLQEVYSTGDHVPELLPPEGTGAGAIMDHPPGEPRTDIASFAAEAGLFLFYAPSMRNGAGPEDRGNAVLANVPLGGLTAIELPYERQRRVAAAAEVKLGARTLRVCSVHLDNRAPWRRAWRSVGPSRTRQMAGLLKGLEARPPSALGGDFNTWVRGTREGAYALARKRFPHPHEVDSSPTHYFELGGVLRHSDHLLFDLPGGWSSRVDRVDDTFGSDHHPLIGRVEAGA